MLLVTGGYVYGKKVIDRRDEVAAVRAELPGVAHVVDVGYGPYAVPDAEDWQALLREVTPEGVEAVMSCFLAAHGLAIQPRPRPAAVAASASEQAEDVICEEILLEASRK